MYSPHIGEENYNNSAHMKMKIIDYASNDKYTVQFEDGSVRTGIHYDSFKKGSVLSPAEQKGKTSGRIGEVYYNAQNELLKIVEYHGTHDVTVEWEDGTRREHVQYSHIKTGNCPRPESMKKPAAKSHNKESYSTNRESEFLRETMVGNMYTLRVRKDLVPVKVISYYNVEKIEVELPSGERQFVRKQRIIDAPTVPPKELCVGQEYTMNCGDTLTVIGWRDCNHVDVKFQDGTVLTDVKALAIWKHRVRNPNVTRNKLLHQSFTLNNGHIATIIAVHKAKDLDVQFEDGAIRKHVQLAALQNGTLCHPDAPQIGCSPSRPEVTCLYYLQKIGFQKLKRGHWKQFHDDFGLMEFDFFHEELKCAGEYDGWHHAQPDTIQRDELKEQLCLQTGITLFRVREKGLDMNCLAKVLQCNIKKTNEEWNALIQDIVEYINTTYNTNYIIDVDVERDADEIDALYAKFHPQCRIYATPIEVFDGAVVCASIASACRKLNVSDTPIIDALRGKKLAACGYFWSDHPLSKEEYTKLYAQWQAKSARPRRRCDVTGQIFGTDRCWVKALYEAEPRRNTNGKIKERRYVCQCKCGAEFQTSMASLRNGSTTSCGCGGLVQSAETSCPTSA